MLKKIITSTAIVLMSLGATSQENCTVKMSMKIEGLPPEYAGFGEQETVTYIKGEKTKTEISSMMFNQTVVFDGKKQTTLSDAMGNKSGYTATKEELEEMDKKEKSDSKPSIEYTTEKKMVAGIECSKAIITSTGKDKKENKMSVWVTDKIKYDIAKNKKMGGRGMTDFGDLKGYPLEIEMNTNQNGMEMKILISATEVNMAPVDDSVFNVSTEGYTMMSLKDFMAKSKAMQGGK